MALSKRSYHTNIKILYSLDLLPSEVYQKIPASTRHYWNNFNPADIFGTDHDLLSEDKIALIRSFVSHKKFLAAAKALFVVFKAFQQMLFAMDDCKAIIRSHKELICKTIGSIAPAIGKARALKYFKLSQQTFATWSLTCTASPLKLCRKAHPAQLSGKEIKTLSAFICLPQFFGWSLKSIYFQALKEHVVFMSISTWYRYCNILNLKKHVFKKLKFGKGLRANKPNETFHVDVSILRPADHTRVYIYLVVDNFSRCILSWRASLVYSATLCLENLRNAGVIPDHIISDDGSENVCLNTVSDHLIAQKDIHFSNSMVEAVFKHLKYAYLFPAAPADFKATVACLEHAVADYNNKPHGALYGLSPLEAYNGAIPDKNRYQEEIVAAAKERLVVIGLDVGYVNARMADWLGINYHFLYYFSLLVYH